MVVYNSIEGQVAVFEVKCSKKLEDMPGDCRKALHQMEGRMYAKEYEDDYDDILCFGISFFKKRCLLMKWEVANTGKPPYVE